MIRSTLSRRERLILLRQEISSYYRFMWHTDRELRGLIFYSAQAQYISFFEGVLNALNGRSPQIGYITSDHDDPILTNHPGHITPIYFNKLFPFVLPFLDARVIVMTMPDLHQFHVRRSIHGANHVYLFHSLMSTHMGFRPGALDHFDTILCAGPHHLEEIRRTEKLYSLKPKRLLQTGYYRLEKIYADHQTYQQAHSLTGNENPTVLIAPSGHELNIVATCARELIATLLQSGFTVVLRPHPMTIYRKPELLRPLIHQFTTQSNFRLDLDTASENSLHRADVLISDWSGVALEYAFGTERPVLFIDLPRRQQNPDFHRVELTPIEIYVRDKIGQVVGRDEIAQAGRIITQFLKQKEQYRERIVDLRARFVYNFGGSSEIAARQIMNIYNGG